MTQPVAPPSLESFFSGGGGKTLSWKGVPIGTVYTGIVKKVHAPQQATDPAQDNAPAFTRQGKPRIQVRIDLATDYRDPQDPDDDGARAIYVGGWMTGAVGDAMRKAGVEGAPQVGATLSVRLIEREDNGPAIAPTNKFDAHYVPPSPAAGFFDTPPAAGGALAPLGAPAAQPQVPVPNISGQGYLPQQPQQPAAAMPPLGAPAPAAQAAQQAVAGMAPLGAPAQQQAPVQAEPAKPDALTQEAWNTMDLSTKIATANIMSNVPPF